MKRAGELEMWGYGGREDDEGGSAASSRAPVGTEFKALGVVSKVLWTYFLCLPSLKTNCSSFSAFYSFILSVYLSIYHLSVSIIYLSIYHLFIHPSTLPSSYASTHAHIYMYECTSTHLHDLQVNCYTLTLFLPPTSTLLSVNQASISPFQFLTECLTVQLLPRLLKKTI